MFRKQIPYQVDAKELQGFVAYENEKEKKPLILVAHAWRGQDDFARQKAEELAQLGYVGFAADVFGKGVLAKSNEESEKLMTPLFLDRELLRRRILAAYQEGCKLPFVDKERIGAIGFCFGGLTVIELLRSGIKLKGIVSFHGLLGEKWGEKQAKLGSKNKMSGSALILHGYEDPLVSQSDIQNFQKEFTEAGIDWQFHTFGQTSHAFTNPIAKEPKLGLIYNPLAAKRAWQAMHNFFEEILYAT